MSSEGLERVSAARSGYHIVADPAVFATTAAAFLARKLVALGESGACSIALSGGSTPGPVYEALARDPHIEWRRLHVYFADERVVPPDDPRSNYRLVRHTLLDRVDVLPDRVHPMPVEADDIDAAAQAYGEGLPERLDLLVLGIGSDGHTASLFPGSPALESEEPVVRVQAPVAPAERLTITPGVIDAARLVVVLARGPEKTPALVAALRAEGDPQQCPARLARRGIWILGGDAARGMRDSLAPAARPRR